MRELLEKAYDEEKAKSVMAQKCNRIYHTLLKSRDSELYDHLIEHQVSPELHLMRWLRCMLSREFSLDLTLLFWDYILGGVFMQHTSSHQSLFAFPLKEAGTRLLEPFPSKENDPFINLDIMCVSMIVLIRQELMESDFSMCLAHLLSF